jgi:hypothetical protein
MMHQPTVLPFEQASETASPWVEMATGHLPETCQSVLVLDRGGQLHIARYRFQNQQAALSSKNTWRVEHSFHCIPTNKVVAWMPIPRRGRATP